MKNTATKASTEHTNNSKTRTKVASKACAANTQLKCILKPQQSSPSTSLSRSIVCKESHWQWECRVFEEKTNMQRAKVVAEAKLCFSCLRGMHMFRQCKNHRKSRKDGCSSTHNTLLQGAERVFPAIPLTNNNNNKTSKSIGGTNMPSTGQQQPSKTITSVTMSKSYFRSRNGTWLILQVPMVFPLSFCNRVAGYGVQICEEPSTEVVKTIKFGIATKEIDKTNTTLSVSVTKSTKEPPPQLIPFDKYSSYQKLLQVTAYALPLLPFQECVRNDDDSIADPPKFDEAKRHLQYLVQGESFNAERKELFENKLLKRSSRIASFSPFIRPNCLFRSAGLIIKVLNTCGLN